MMERIPLEEALMSLGRRDAMFNAEVKSLLAPVKDRFFGAATVQSQEQHSDGLSTAPPYLAEPDLRAIGIALAELAIERGINVNLACESDGSTFLHKCALLRDPAIAAEAVAWLMAHGADPRCQRNDSETPLSLALKFNRTKLVELMSFYRDH